MDRINLLAIFGTRPEATKMAPVIMELMKDDRFETRTAVTAQHREQLDQVLEAFGIAPSYDLNLMKARQKFSYVLSEAVKGLEEIIASERPDMILVHGDTTTTFAGALAGFYGGVKVGHVEAGLRSFDKLQPYPEEMNRKLTSSLADVHFAPTNAARDNLLRENVSPRSVYVTGNTAVDLLKYTLNKDYVFENGFLNGIDYSKRIIAMTAHRSENLGGPMENICRAVLRLTEEHPDMELVYPVHLNPAVRETVFRMLSGRPRVHLLDPVSVGDLHNLMDRSFLILTDSGGIQEEAPSMDVPVVVMRNVTERPEGVAAGALVVAGVEENGIYGAADAIIKDGELYGRMARAKNPYGDGSASERIVSALLHEFGVLRERPEDFG